MLKRALIAHRAGWARQRASPTTAIEALAVLRIT